MPSFVLNGVPMVLDLDAAVRRLHGVRPETVREHGVLVGNVIYPVKQAFEVASGVPRTEFTSQTALRHLTTLGFEVVSSAGLRPSDPPHANGIAGLSAPIAHYPRGWPWEGCVQVLFAQYLREHGWAIQAMANTATKARGVDVLAHKDSRRMGAEVKGWPSDRYADTRRGTETKATRPSTQAGHWFSQALFKAVMLLDSHPGHDSLIVLPDYPRYRDLADRTRTGREAADIHIVLVDRHGAAHSGTWSP